MLTYLTSLLFIYLKLSASYLSSSCYFVQWMFVSDCKQTIDFCGYYMISESFFILVLCFSTFKGVCYREEAGVINAS